MRHIFRSKTMGQRIEMKGREKKQDNLDKNVQITTTYWTLLSDRLCLAEPLCITTKYVPSI